MDDSKGTTTWWAEADLLAIEDTSEKVEYDQYVVFTELQCLDDLNYSKGSYLRWGLTEWSLLPVRWSLQLATVYNREMSRHDTHLWEDILLHISMNEALFWPLHPLVHYLYTNVTRNPAKKYCFASIHQCCIVFKELHNVSRFSLQVLNSMERRERVWKYNKFFMSWMPDDIKCEIKSNKFSGKNAGFIRDPQALDFLTTHSCRSNRIVHFGSICVYMVIVRQFIMKLLWKISELVSDFACLLRDRWITGLE